MMGARGADRPCLTVDVEDWYEGMAALGHPRGARPNPEPGLEALARMLDGRDDRLTLFVVGRWVEREGERLRALAAQGHEIGSHGPDHGHLPREHAELVAWLRRGREQVEDAVGAGIAGFRSPRFDCPEGMSLAEFRDAIAEAGFEYVSDTHRLGSGPIVELPVASLGPLPVGGGSYQRLAPRMLTPLVCRRLAAPVVLYYHSYDFGAELPSLRWGDPPAVVSQLLVRGRIAPTFARVLDTLGSRTCREAVHAVR